MLPTASVSGYAFAHPQAAYFGVGRIGKDQLEDYARRKGMDVAAVQRWLASNLDPLRGRLNVCLLSIDAQLYSTNTPHAKDTPRMEIYRLIVHNKVVFFISLLVLACLALGIGSIRLILRQFSQPEPTPTSIPVHYYPVDTQVEIYYEMGLDGSGDNPYEEIQSIDWQPDGTLIAIATTKSVYLYDVADGNVRELLDQTNNRWTVAWNSDGRKLAGDDHALWMWDSVTDTVEYSPEQRGDYDFYGCTLWSPDDRFIAGCSFSLTKEPSSVRIWDTTTRSVQEYSVQGTKGADALAWGPDGQYMAVSMHSGASYSMQIVDFESRDIVRTLGTDAVVPASWSPDGSLLATRDKKGGVFIWDTTTWQPITTFAGGLGDIGFLKWHSEGEHLATVSDDGVRIWNVETGNSNIVQTERVLTLDWNSDGSRLVTAVNNEIYIWDTTPLP